MSATPTSGRNTAAERAHESKSIACLLRGEDEGEAEDSHRAEEDGRVLLHAPGLDGAKGGTALLGGETDPVDGAVDDLLVDDVVREAADGPHGDADRVHDAVEDALVGPVGGPCDGALDRAHHHAGPEVVEVVAVGQERVTRTERADALGDAVRPGVAPVPEVGDGDACEARSGADQGSG